MQSFQIGSNEKDQRFDKYLKKLLQEAPGSFIYKMLRKKNITLNGKKADGSEKLKQGDEVKLFLSDETIQKFSRAIPNASACYPSIPLEVLYEDKDILAINKPVGMLSQKADAKDISANEYIIGYLLKKQEITEQDLLTFRPSVCNRLDRNTSGLLVAGKSLRGLQDMAKQFNSRLAEKYYRCLVKGKVLGARTLEGWLSKDGQDNQVTISKQESPGSKYIKMKYVPVESYKLGEQNIATLLEVQLITGRSHQIRVQLASVGHPVIGDHKYGERAANEWFTRKFRVHSQLLHAYRMRLSDGRELTAPLNGEFQKVIDDLQKNKI